MVNRTLAFKRLNKIEEGQTAEFVKEQRSQNTVRKTDGTIKLFAQWLIQSKKKKRDIEYSDNSSRRGGQYVSHVHSQCQERKGEQYWKIPEGDE